LGKGGQGREKKKKKKEGGEPGLSPVVLIVLLQPPGKGGREPGKERRRRGRKKKLPTPGGTVKAVIRFLGISDLEKSKEISEGKKKKRRRKKKKKGKKGTLWEGHKDPGVYVFGTGACQRTDIGGYDHELKKRRGGRKKKKEKKEKKKKASDRLELVRCSPCADFVVSLKERGGKRRGEKNSTPSAPNHQQRFPSRPRDQKRGEKGTGGEKKKKKKKGGIEAAASALPSVARICGLPDPIWKGREEGKKEKKKKEKDTKKVGPICHKPLKPNALLKRPGQRRCPKGGREKKKKKKKKKSISSEDRRPQRPVGISNRANNAR